MPQKYLLLTHFEIAIVILEISDPLDDAHAGAVAVERQGVDAQVVREAFPCVFSIGQSAVGFLFHGARTHRVAGREVDEFEYMWMLEPDPAGEQLRIQMLSIWVGETEGVFLDEFAGGLVANEGG